MKKYWLCQIDLATSVNLSVPFILNPLTHRPFEINCFSDATCHVIVFSSRKKITKMHSHKILTIQQNKTAGNSSIGKCCRPEHEN